MRNHLESNSLRDKITGQAFQSQSPLKARLSSYHQKISSGKVFGQRTADMLPDININTENSINEYFDRIDNALNYLQSVYNLGSIYSQKSLSAIKNEASRLMWVFGITIDLFHDDQRGLLLMGAASSTLSLKAVPVSKDDDEQRFYETERKKIGFIVRMLAQTSKGTYSVNVDKWLDKSVNRMNDPLNENNTLFLRRALSEAQYTDPAKSTFIGMQATDLDSGKKSPVVNLLYKKSARIQKIALDHIDEELSAQLGPHTPWIQQIVNKLGVEISPNLQWIATTFSPQEFVQQFEGQAVITNNCLIFPNDIESLNNKKNQQHEFNHAIMRHSPAPYLGRGLGNESDAESTTFAPSTYPEQRLLTYLVDDAIDADNNIKVGQGWSEYFRIRSAIKRAKGILNSAEERKWNRSLLKSFGLEGYLTFYLVHEESAILDPLVKANLLTSRQGAARLKCYRESIRNKTKKPAYIPWNLDKVNPYGRFEEINKLWINSLGYYISEEIKSPRASDKLERLSFAQASAYLNRLEACRSSYDYIPYSNRPLTDEIVLMRKYLWLKKGLPLLPDQFYSLVTSVIDFRFLLNNQKSILIWDKQGGVIQFTDFPQIKYRPLQKDIFKGNLTTVAWIADKLISHLQVFPGENKSQLYRQLIATLALALEKDYGWNLEYVHKSADYQNRLSVNSGKKMSELYRHLAEAVLSEHYRLMSEENGNFSKIADRMITEFLQPLTYFQE
ncbi:hypothetical protein A2781_05080 [Candidatus Gottesmanbacteria bacterium RIFCSPHIGHO2_01_FULL_42_27]|uniref:Uncharacterized protein n=1 Tax=Candidatus Gottesmanbacteria bacterium RIFCSPLOWO2_01_FULL_42_22 TaxID=1798391 RepID=A0A1F6BJ69_9BACT|nr:MAG: hypothetical protein A2781_05080 [Candidatus Gottesmanbacteria bacterium RIFCSPHIGHO2_01_FULL_42_27]OGG20732.1 MAG: hypothetical protein A3E72_05980 [Candidatus Gottesmanbacteria bacterium RIFCSPHIGHO2_12_FULL_43_26]OGG36986.1 MAG: hypothetical protein A2968_01770 [Candidatus Gottesmanbacteria bacterium RIFCSPLOWO2_01_FULL_42_22]